MGSTRSRLFGVFYNEDSTMLRTWRGAWGNDRTRRSRVRAHAYRPRSEELESRALMTLFPGDPITLTPTAFMGVGTTAAGTALSNFKTATGGTNNTTGSPGVPVAAGTGFRTITWDGVKLDGTDFGGGANTTVVNQGKTIIIPKDR